MKTVFKEVILATALCALAAPVFADDTDMTTNLPPSAVVLTPADFAWDAALISLEEIRLGGVAQTNSQNADVQEFGRHMVREHTRMYDRLVKIAGEEGLELPDTNAFYQTVTMPPEKQATELMESTTPQDRMLAVQLDVQDLTDLSGADFDHAYADANVKGHEKAIEKFEDAASSLQDERLKKYAKKCLPTLRHHLEMAEKLQAELTQNPNGSSGSTMTNMPASMPGM